jgi:hypothetical protein
LVGVVEAIRGLGERPDKDRVKADNGEYENQNENDSFHHFEVHGLASLVVFLVVFHEHPGNDDDENDDEETFGPKDVNEGGSCVQRGGKSRVQIGVVAVGELPERGIHFIQDQDNEGDYGDD